jgi:F-type H+-transporting ATPase subunit b
MNEDCLENERRLQESIAEARREGFNVKEEIKKQGLDKEKQLLAEASSEARERLDRARGDIDSTLGGVRQALQAEVDKFSQELAEKILGRSF